MSAFVTNSFPEGQTDAASWTAATWTTGAMQTPLMGPPQSPFMQGPVPPPNTASWQMPTPAAPSFGAFGAPMMPGSFANPWAPQQPTTPMAQGWYGGAGYQAPAQPASHFIPPSPNMLALSQMLQAAGAQNGGGGTAAQPPGSLDEILRAAFPGSQNGGSRS